MAKLTEKDILSSPALTDELFGNDKDAPGGLGKVVRISITALKNLILGNRSIGLDESGSIVTLDGNQTMSNKILDECTLKAVAIDVDSTVNIDYSPVKVGEAIASKDNKHGPSERGTNGYLYFTTGGSGDAVITDEEVLASMGYSGDELTSYAIEGRTVVMQLRSQDGSSYSVIGIDGTDIKGSIATDANGTLVTIDFAGLSNTQEYDLAITAKVIDRPA